METANIKTAFSYESDLEMLLHILESPLHNKLIWASNIAFRVVHELMLESLDAEYAISTLQVTNTSGYIVIDNNWKAWNIKKLGEYKYLTSLEFSEPDYNSIPDEIRKAFESGEYCKIKTLEKNIIICFQNAFARVSDNHIWQNRRKDCRALVLDSEELEALDLICTIFHQHSQMFNIYVSETDISFALESMTAIIRKLIFKTNTIAYKLDVRQRDYIDVIIGEIAANAF